MEELYSLVKSISKFYKENPIEWFSIIAMNGDIVLRMSADEFNKHPELLEKCNTERKEQGISFSKEMKDIIVQAFQHIPKEDKFNDIFENICELDAEWFLPDSIKWLMFDCWMTTLETMLRIEHRKFTIEQQQKIQKIREAINYVE